MREIRQMVLLRKLCIVLLPLALPILLNKSSGIAHADTAGKDHSKLATVTEGREIYEHVCQSCHMQGGVGAHGAGANIPALSNNQHLEAETYLPYVVIHGFVGMPALGGMLSDPQIAAVSNYVRMHFGNSYSGSATAVSVSQLR